MYVFDFRQAQADLGLPFLEIVIQTGVTAGRRGPALLQDIWLIEKMAYFDREVIPERRMQGLGSLRHLHRHS
jgi:catalase